MKCWAAAAGQCSSEQSGEHLLTKSLFTDHIVIKGLAWCMNGKQIGINSAVSNILCRSHNNYLSTADNAAVSLKNFSEGAYLRKKRYQKPKSKKDLTGPAFRSEINGHSLELWAFKTMMNLTKCGSYSLSGNLPENIDQYVQKTFNGKGFDAPTGLFLCADINEMVTSGTPYETSLLYTESEKVISGLKFRFQGFRFLFSYNKNPALAMLTGKQQNGIYRPKQIRLNSDGIGSKLLARLILNWEK